MQKCSYCGRENEDAATRCGGCSTSLSEEQRSMGVFTPHKAFGVVQGAIWEYFAVKRRQFYLAGLLIGLLAGLIGALRNPEHGFLLPVLACGLMAVGAVWLLSFAEKLQVRIDQARAEGNPVGALRVLFVVLGLFALVLVVLLVAGVCANFL
jgi:hypothetical protein